MASTPYLDSRELGFTEHRFCPDNRPDRLRLTATIHTRACWQTRRDTDLRSCNAPRNRASLVPWGHNRCRSAESSRQCIRPSHKVCQKSNSDRRPGGFAGIQCTPPVPSVPLVSEPAYLMTLPFGRLEPGPTLTFGAPRVDMGCRQLMRSIPYGGFVRRVGLLQLFADSF